MAGDVVLVELWSSVDTLPLHVHVSLSWRHLSMGGWIQLRDYSTIEYWKQEGEITFDIMHSSFLSSLLIIYVDS